MHLLTARLTVGRLMIAIAIVAILLPFPVGAIMGLAFIALAFWLPVLIVALSIDMIIPRVAANIAALAALSLVGFGVWFYSPHSTWQTALLDSAMSGLTMANFAGPLYVGRRFRRGEPLTSGHLLWAWSGFLWAAGPFIAFPPMHSRGAEFQGRVEGCRLTLALAVLLALYGSRPVEKGAAWGHHAGWLLVECQVIVWGCQAAQYLR